MGAKLERSGFACPWLWFHLLLTSSAFHPTSQGWLELAQFSLRFSRIRCTALVYGTWTCCLSRCTSYRIQWIIHAAHHVWLVNLSDFFLRGRNKLYHCEPKNFRTEILDRSGGGNTNCKVWLPDIFWHKIVLSSIIYSRHIHGNSGCKEFLQHQLLPNERALA